MNLQTTNGTGDRDAAGRFARGNAGGPGNPHARRVARLRSAILKALDGPTMQRIIAAMVRKAEGGDVAAAVLVLSYAVGRPRPIDDDQARGETTLFQFTFNTLPAPHTIEAVCRAATLPNIDAGALPRDKNSNQDGV